MQIYISKNGARTGPFSEAEVRGMLAEGLAAPTDLAWREGSDDWQPLGNLLGLSQPPSLPPPPPFAPPGVTQSSGPTGVGGWLVFFCVSLTILGPLASLVQMVTTWAAVKPAFDTLPSLKGAILFEDLGVTAIVIYGFIVGCLIWGGSPRGRVLAKRFLLIRLLAFIGIEVIAVFLMSDLPAENVQGAMEGAAKALVQVFVYFAVWWSYFKTSKRVKNTYGDGQA